MGVKEAGEGAGRGEWREGVEGEEEGRMRLEGMGRGEA